MTSNKRQKSEFSNNPFQMFETKTGLKTLSLCFTMLLNEVGRKNQQGKCRDRCYHRKNNLRAYSKDPCIENKQAAVLLSLDLVTGSMEAL